MVSGIALILVALMLLITIGYQMLLEHSRALELLDRRIATRIGTTGLAAATPQSAHVRIPDIIVPLFIRAQLVPTPRGMLIGAFALAALVIGALITSGPLAALLAAILPAAALLYHVQRRARTRTEALLEALPFFLDAVRQLLTIGNSLSQALTRTMPTAPAAVSSYLAPAIRRIELGVPVVDSLQQLSTTLRIPEISMLVAAIRVNQRFGGPMAQVLGNLANIVRERGRIKREIRGATSEVRVSTVLLIIMPILFASFFLLTSHAYVEFFLGEARGRHLAMIAAGLQLTGMAIMARLMRPVF